MSDTVHNLTVQVTVMNSSNTFWFDNFRYTPTSTVNAPVNNVTVYVSDSDPSIEYGLGWGTTEDGMLTQLSGTKVTFEFVGVQVTWYGMRMNTSLASTSATYSIDGDTPVSFPLPEYSLPEPAYEQIIFQTGQLSFGNHVLEVVYGGNAQTAPLSLQFFVIQNSAIVTSSPSVTSSVGPTVLPSNSAPKGKLKSQIGPFTGCVFGSVTIIVILICLLHHQRSRKRPKIEPFKTLDFATPLSTTVQNFNPSPPEREPTTNEKRPPCNRISVRPIHIQTTGKVFRTDGVPEIVSIANGSDGNIALTQNGSIPVRTVRHEDSWLPLPEREDVLVVELPPLYTAG
ncbi:hypothetical protein GALMADRAFT_144060 [Galerina marginata CBS 339.88]|uniref:Transmembrane protein n=1 Tax=Galerina marginata (strain CBS 339.88) TaxID=685588 RepID=A0A067SKB1_GALM3|nr:hypothetical protein GALMADRAFT_144060 [Galerina marginata CBS 339.88]